MEMDDDEDKGMGADDNEGKEASDVEVRKWSDE